MLWAINYAQAFEVMKPNDNLIIMEEYDDQTGAQTRGNLKRILNEHLEATESDNLTAELQHNQGRCLIYFFT
ncbi:hypothetical protein VNO77_00600 [Canavalia gladiata]|uniref:Uncharacterized protein n=1 Tax=Canavalia gladiata TaxID=3824 RepID=A0AAN9MQA6_CANGL